jgi:hypothetical protein
MLRGSGFRSASVGKPRVSIAAASCVRSPVKLTSSLIPRSTEYVTTAARSRSFIRLTTKSRAARLALKTLLG